MKKKSTQQITTIETLSLSEKISDWRIKLNGLIDIVNKHQVLLKESENNPNIVLPLAVSEGGTGTTSARDAINVLLPPQRGNSEKFLKTNGTDVEWVSLTPPTKLEAIPGCLPVASGGTGVTSIAALRAKLFSGLSTQKKQSLLSLDDKGEVVPIAIDTMNIPAYYAIEEMSGAIEKLQDESSDLGGRVGRIFQEINKITKLLKSNYNSPALLGSDGNTDVKFYRMGKAGEYLLSLENFDEFFKDIFAAIPKAPKPIEDISEKHTENALLIGNEDGGIDYIPVSQDIEQLLRSADLDDIREYILPAEGNFFAGLRDLQTSRQDKILIIDENGDADTSYISKQGRSLLSAETPEELEKLIGFSTDKMEKAISLSEKIDAADPGILYKDEASKKVFSLPLHPIGASLLSMDSRESIRDYLDLSNVVKFSWDVQTSGKIISLDKVVLSNPIIGNHDILRDRRILTGPSTLRFDVTDASQYELLCNNAEVELSLSNISSGPPKISFAIYQKMDIPTVIKWDRNSFLIDENGIDLSHRITYLEFARLTIGIKDIYACVLQKGFDLET